MEERISFWLRPIQSAAAAVENIARKTKNFYYSSKTREPILWRYRPNQGTDQGGTDQNTSFWSWGFCIQWEECSLCTKSQIKVKTYHNHLPGSCPASNSLASYKIMLKFQSWKCTWFPESTHCPFEKWKSLCRGIYSKMQQPYQKIISLKYVF